MTLYEDFPATVPYREVLEVGNRLEKAWKERKTDAFLTKIEHRPVRQPISDRPPSSGKPLVCRSSQAVEEYLPVKSPRKSISSARDIDDSPLHFRQHTLADPPFPGDSAFSITYTGELRHNNATASPTHPRALSPPTNSAIEWKRSPNGSLIVSKPPCPEETASSGNHKVAKPISVPRHPRVYSISPGIYPLRKLSLPSDALYTPEATHAADPIDSGSKQVTSRRSPTKGLTAYGGASPVRHGSKSPAAMCSTKATDMGYYSKANQYVPPVVRNPLARPQALLPFNPRRTTKQYRQEIMDLGPPPEIKPMVMTESRTKYRPKSTQYDLATKGAANLLKFDRLEFRVHRPPSAGSNYVTGTYYSNGALQKPLTPRSIRRTDITGRNVIITEFDADPQGGGDIPFSNLLDVR